MKKFTNINEANSQKYMNKSQLYLLSIPYCMYKEYGQYKEDWESLKKDDIQDLEDTQKFLDSMSEDERVRFPYKKMPVYFQYGIKKICEICLKHQEDYDKLDIRLFKEILNEIS